MASEQVHPLRISKNTPTPSPKKMGTGLPRPLSELSPAEVRRNSPSWHQTGSPKKSMQHPDSSPFQSSPVESVTSPRMFWQNRNSESFLYGGGTASPSPNRRSSIERLQRASRVKNSNILALEQKQEYDPTRIPQIERPLAKVQSKTFGSSASSSSFGSTNTNNTNNQRPIFGHHRNESKISLPMMSPTKQSNPAPTGSPTRPLTPSKEQVSPTKSSLSSSRFKSSFDLETGTWAETSPGENDNLPPGRVLHRHAKSVTFDAAPPQINEYEMATPDLSSIGTNSREGSFESLDDDDDEMLYDPGRVDIQDDSFDASLEDTDKTPVVGPEDWRGDSPLTQRGGPQQYESSPMPENTPSMASPGRASMRRSDSTTSNGEHRPLPPLPGFADQSRTLSGRDSPASPGGLSATAERMLGAQRNLPNLPPASSTSKSDIQNIGNTKMSLEERLKLMMLSDDNDGKSAAEQQRERRLRRCGGRERLNSPASASELESIAGASEQQEDDAIGDISGFDDYQLPPRISRESIMRKVNKNSAEEPETEYTFSSPPPSSSPVRAPERLFHLDPDVPIPSTEDTDLDELMEDDEGSVIITRMPEDFADDVLDFYGDSDLEDEDDLAQQPADTDGESIYSEQEPVKAEPVQPEPVQTEPAKTEPINAEPLKTESLKIEPLKTEPEHKSKEVVEEVITPRATTPVETPVENKSLKDSLLALGTESGDNSFSRDLESYMISEPEKPKEPESKPEPEVRGPKMSDAQAYLQRPFTPEPLSKPEYDGTGWGEPGYELEEPGTPESVIHHPMLDDEEDADVEEVEPLESPAIPERQATIKAHGSKLKTRVSNTPSDISAMREARRQVSVEIPDVPPIPDKHRGRLSTDLTTSLLPTGDEFLDRHPSFKNRSLTLDLDIGLSLDQDFERVIEAQKVAFDHSFCQQSLNNHPGGPVSASSTNSTNSDIKDLHANITSRPQRGYLMRQNTKLITASDKDTDDSFMSRSAGNSPVKRDRPQSWVVEPWNSKPRPRSGRKRTAMSTGPIPPMPGQESNAIAPSQVTEDDYSVEMATADSGERGRLFVKVMGVKDLDLPIPKNERTWFSLTLDNGVHCVTTAWLELARNAPIGQEFELVVPNDLEFQLTLNVKLEKPAPVKAIPTAAPQHQPAARTTKHKTSTFSRVFTSPKKRKEQEQLRQREEEERVAQQQRDAQAAQAKQRSKPLTPYDLLSPLAAEDGSFARAYVCLREHENRCFGRPYMAEVACFNEWATEEAGFAHSVKSKRGNATVVRRAPYKIGKLELQLLFVPRPKNAVDEDMPKSMNSCIRELKAAEERLSRSWEGHLSQQGGDCPYWRRRYFKLVGTKLTAYHEATRQPRATINLSNAKRLIDDRRSLTERETTGRGGRRRRSAFAEEEEGYMFVEEGFRIRFNNGEVIDFYADTAEDKEGWMKVLSDVIGRDGMEEDTSGPRSRAKWCQLVLKREEQLRRRASGRRVHSRTKSMYL